LSIVGQAGQWTPHDYGKASPAELRLQAIEPALHERLMNGLRLCGERTHGLPSPGGLEHGGAEPVEPCGIHIRAEQA
jgi:hypothetical protein